MQPQLDVEVTEDQQIILTSEVIWERLTGEGVLCTDDCNTASAEVEFRNLEAGEYEIIYADDVMLLTIPGEQRLCLGNYPIGSRNQ